MTTIYALLVGVDRYAAEPDVPALSGCVNDVDDVLAMLQTTATAGTTVAATVLRNEEATVHAVITALRVHLTRAGEADTAFFWFSGHGSQAPAPAEAWVVEPTGLVQTLVCHDSRSGGVPDLWDKELSVLLDIVAERAGHVAVVLDSCHSEGSTRQIGSRWRAAPIGLARDPGLLLPELIERGAGPATPGSGHIALSACRRDQQAEERTLGGVPHGLFTWSLLRSLSRLGPSATYRDLLGAARSEVARQRAYDQVPQLYAPGAGLADRQFLRGTAGATGTGLELSYGLDGWQVDLGSAHGLPSDANGAGLRFGVRGTNHEVEAVRVWPERTRVRPIAGWQPRPDQQFPVVLTALSRPAITYAVAGGARAPAAPLAALLRTGLSSGYARPAEPGEAADLTVGTGPGGVRITDRQGHGADVGATVDQVHEAIEHISRWLRLLDLTNPASALGEPIRLDIVPADSGQLIARLDTVPLRLDADGAFHLSYTRTEAGWTAPEIFIRLHNTSGRQLYVTLLDLTPRYEADPRLFPVAPIGAGRDAAALEGRRIRVTLPEGERVEPGRAFRDWLVVVVSERPFSADPYRLPPLAGAVTRGPAGRDLGEATVPSTTGEDWTVQRYALITEVPDSQDGSAEAASAPSPSGSSTVIVR